MTNGDFEGLRASHDQTDITETTVRLGWKNLMKSTTAGKVADGLANGLCQRVYAVWKGRKRECSEIKDKV
jgi:hypothetical protein